VGFTGLINFSVAAFFGIGAYGSALMTASGSPIAGGFNPIVGLVVALVAAFVLALLIGIPTLRLRADYLAIASLGLAEVVRLIVLNERWLTTNGAQGCAASRASSRGGRCSRRSRKRCRDSGSW